MATANLTAVLSTKGAAKSEADLKKVAKQAANTERNVNRMGGAFQSVSRNAGAAAAAITGPLGGVSSRISAVTTILTSGTAAATLFGVAIAGAGFAIVQGSIALDEYDVNLKRVNATIKATGEGVGFTALQLQEQSAALALATLTSTQEVQKAQAKLLTFNRVLGTEFQQAIEISQDLAEAGFGSITSNAVLLGKALQDPVKGISALTRVGVTLDQNQKDLIANAVKQNDIFSAQRVILDALEGQVGGVASAVATGTAAGAVDTLGQRYDELTIAIGKSTNSLGVYKQIVNGAIVVTESLIDLFEETPAELFTETLAKTIELAQAESDLAAMTSKASQAYRDQFINVINLRNEAKALRAETKSAAEEQAAQIKDAGDAAIKEADARKKIALQVKAENKKTSDDKAAKAKKTADKLFASAQKSALREIAAFEALNLSKIDKTRATEEARTLKIDEAFSKGLISAEQYQSALSEIEFNGELTREQIRTAQAEKQVDNNVSALAIRTALFDEQNKVAIEAGEVLSSSLAGGLLDVAKGEQKLGDVIVGTIGKVADSVSQALLQQVIQEQIVDKVTGAAYLKTKSAEALVAQQQAGLNAFASTAAIPVVGPALAPAAAATATGIASGLASGVIAAASARQQGGNLSAGQTSTLTENNEFEVIAPASASRVRTRQQMASIMGEGGGVGGGDFNLTVIDQSTGGKEFSGETTDDGRFILLIRDTVSGDLQNSNSDIGKARKDTRGQSGF